LANSRPIEGLVVSLPAVTLLLGWLIKNRRFLGWRAVTKVVVPIAAVLLLTAAGMLWYNFRITGNPLRMAYQEHEEQYGAVPAMFWQRLPAEKTYRHAAIRDFHFSYEITRYREQQSLPGWSVIAVAKAKMVMSYAMDGVVFVLPWLVLAWIMRNRWMRFAALTCGLLAVLLLQETFTLPHYVAPVTCLFFAMVMQGFRHIRLWRWHGQPLGRAVIAAVPVVCLATLAFSLVTDVRSADPRSAPIQRARLISQLREDRAKHLIIVRYGAEPAYDGWVYNEADIDAAPVVWAREMDAEHNHRLLAYFHDRRVWLLDTDIQPAVLVPYPDDYATQRVAGDVHGSH
jgi:hypothetical protein